MAMDGIGWKTRTQPNGKYVLFYILMHEVKIQKIKIIHASPAV